MEARKHLCSNKGLFFSNNEFKKLLHEQPKLYHEFVDYNEIKKELCLPRKDLDKTWRYYNEYSCNPLPKEALILYLKTEKLYEAIIAEKNNFEKWFDLICQVPDTKYIHNNIEYQIGNDMTNKELWKLYIKYLQKNDTKRLLYIYSCYCRFFLDDANMKEEYRTACKKFGPSIVHWKNAFDFEIFVNDEITEEMVKQKCEKRRKKEEKEYCAYLINETDLAIKRKDETKTENSIKFGFENAKNQIFSLPKTIISYIIEQENFKIFIKFQQSCKYFFSVLPYPVCYNLIVTHFNSVSNIPHYIDSFKQSTRICYSDQKQHASKKLNFDRKFIISNSFHCFHRNDNLMLSKFLPNIFQCNIKHLRIDKQNFTFKEYEFLVGYGNVETLTLQNVELINDKKEIIELQEILILTPKIVEFVISEPKITEQTFQILAQLNFLNKFKIFKLYYIEYLEPYGLAEFMKKNLNSNSEFVARFDLLHTSHAKNAIQIVKNELKIFWPKNKQPKIEVSDPWLHKWKLNFLTYQ